MATDKNGDSPQAELLADPFAGAERGIRPTNLTHAEVTVESREDAMRSLLDLDPSTLDRGFKYRWVYKASLKVARKKAKGYTVVNPSTEPGIKNLVGDSPDIAEDGTYTVMDVVLMRCPKSVHKARRKRVKERTDDRIRGPVRKYKATAKKLGRSRRLSAPVKVITNEEP